MKNSSNTQYSTSEILIKSIEHIQRVCARDNANARSDGGGSGRSDTNDNITM